VAVVAQNPAAEAERRENMEKSAYEARWLLAPMFLVGVRFMVFGSLVG
jgi:hypothetical protein